MNKAIPILAVCLAVIAAAVAGIKITGDRTAAARAELARAESAEVRAVAEARKARADEAAEASRAEAKKSEAEAALENRKAEEAKLETEKIAAARAKDEAAAKAAAAEEAKARAREASELAAAEKAKAAAAKSAAEEARVKAESETAKAAAEAQAAADLLAAQKLKSDAIIAEAKALELRKIDFETVERNLIEYQQELDERERALHPDKTAAADLAWVAEREPDVIGETNRLRRTKKVLPECDPALPRGSRRLARADRLKAEDAVLCSGVSSNTVVSTMVRLYERALREDRVVDAQFYHKSIKSLYPHWQYRPVAEAEDGKKKEEEK